MTTTRSIKLPLQPERYGKHLVQMPTDFAPATPAEECTVRNLRYAVMRREDTRRRGHGRIGRLSMRCSALWARVFAGQISETDPRLEEAIHEHSRLVHALVRSRLPQLDVVINTAVTTRTRKARC